MYQISSENAWQHCKFGYLQILVKIYFYNKYFDAVHFFLKLPTKALGMMNSMICREFKYIKAAIRMEAIGTWYFQYESILVEWLSYCLRSQYMVGVGVTKSVVQSSARNKHINESDWITREYSGECSLGSVDCYPF